MGRLLENTTPMYEHDCNKCQFLGTYAYRDLGDNFRNTDLYFCKQMDTGPNELFGDILIGRYSDEPSDNTSGMWAGQMQYLEARDTPLAKAFELGIEKGFIDKDTNFRW